jgi:Transglycosylase
MRRAAKLLAVVLGIVIATAAISVTIFEATVVQPALGNVHDLLLSATPSEWKLPEPVERILHREPGARIKYLVARNLLAAEPNDGERMSTTQRQFAELGLGLSLEVHLTSRELHAVYASQAYMGPGVRGFDQAARQYLGIQLHDVTLSQAAFLVAVAHGPSAYLESPERLERRVQYLLAKVRE